MMETREIVALVEEWEALKLGNPEHGARRAEILRYLLASGNPWFAAYNAARMAGYLNGLASVNVFMRMLQAECERQEAK